MLDKLLIEYDRCAVPAKSEKVERPGQADSVKVLGMWVCKDGKILPDAEKLAVLIARTHQGSQVFGCGSLKIFNVFSGIGFGS